MNWSKRLAIIALAVVAFALTITGITIAATDSNPVAVGRDPLVLNGYPPSSAKLLLSITTGSTHAVHAIVNIDFSNNALEVTSQVPAVAFDVPVDVRAIDGKVFVGSPAVPGGAYVGAPLTLPQLYGVSLEMTKPDIALITGLGQPTTTTSGYTTTYSFHRDKVAVSNMTGAPGPFAGVGALDLRISVGSQGEATGASLTVSAQHLTTTISLTVLAYNQKVSISAPPASAVKMVSGMTLRRLLTSLNLGRMMLPTNLLSLGQLRLN